jgi:hypothetical protein
VARLIVCVPLALAAGVIVVLGGYRISAGGPGLPLGILLSLLAFLTTGGVAWFMYRLISRRGAWSK